MPARARPLLKMSPPLESFPRAEAELLVLRAMCQGTPQGSVRAAAVRILKDYRWREPVHQAIFHCLGRFSSADLEFLRAELPACLTRNGFPDVGWAAFFGTLSLKQQEFRELLLQLKRPDLAHYPADK